MSDHSIHYFGILYAHLKTVISVTELSFCLLHYEGYAYVTESTNHDEFRGNPGNHSRTSQ